jgi:hypothetical protein
MRLVTVNRRVTNLENALDRLKAGQKTGCSPTNEKDASALPLLKQLQKLAQETERIKDETVASGDYRAALACVHELSRILELIAKMGGALDAKIQKNILDVNLDPQAGKRIAEMYLARLRNQEEK